MNRIQAIKYTMAYREALNELAGRFGYSYPLHDLDKIFLYVIFGKKITGKIHRLYSKHHEHIDDLGYYHIEDKIQAAFDWECSRFTLYTNIGLKAVLKLMCYRFCNALDFCLINHLQIYLLKQQRQETKGFKLLNIR